MVTASDADPTPTLGRREWFVVGVVACACALLSTPVASAAGALHFVGGAAVSLALPVGFGVVGLAAGVRLSRLGATRRGVGLALAGPIAALAGALYGVAAVF